MTSSDRVFTGIAGLLCLIALVIGLGSAAAQDDPSPDEAVGGGNQVLPGGVSYGETAPVGDVFSSNGGPDVGQDIFSSGAGSTDEYFLNGGADDGGTPEGTPDPDFTPLDPMKAVPLGPLPCGMNQLEGQAWGPGGVAMLRAIIPDCKTVFGRRPPLQGYVSNTPERCSPLSPEARRRLREMAQRLDDMVGCGAGMAKSLAADWSKRSEFIRGFVDPIEGTLRSYAQKPGQPLSQTATAVVNFLANDDPNKFEPLRDAALKAIDTARTNPQYAAGAVAGNLAMMAGPGAVASCPAKLVSGAAKAGAGVLRAVKAARRLAGAEKAGTMFGNVSQFPKPAVPSQPAPPISGRITNSFYENNRCVPSSIAQVKTWATGKRFYTDDIQLRFSDTATSSNEVQLLLWKNFGKKVFRDHSMRRRIDQMFGTPVAANQGAIAQELLTGGTESSGIVFIEGLTDASGNTVNHAFVAKNVAGQVRYYDAAYEWNPSSVPTDASGYFTQPHSNVYFYRTN